MNESEKEFINSLLRAGFSSPVCESINDIRKVVFEGEDDSNVSSTNQFYAKPEHAPDSSTENGDKIDWSSFPDPDIQKGIDLMRKINEHGYEAYIVGGCVRDIVNGSKDVHDVDIATNMPIAELKRAFNTADNGGEKHGTILVENDGVMFEVTQFRTETGYSDGRHPDNVSWTDSFEDDTRRRDFTINAMGIDADGNVIDYNGGVADLRNRILRTVGDPTERFTEDALRIIRAMRFAARFDMTIAEDTLKGMIACKGQLNRISMERVRDELIKTAEYGAKQFASVVSLMNDTGCGEIIDPNGFIDWEKARNLADARATDPLFAEMDKDVIVSLALLFYGTNDAKTAMQYFRCTVEQIRSVGFIYRNLDNYRRLGELDPIGAINVVKNKDFDRLREVNHAIYGDDGDYADLIPTVRMLIREAAPRFNDISRMMREIGIQPGPNYGSVLEKVANRMCEMYISGVEPTDEQIMGMLLEYVE